MLVGDCGKGKRAAVRSTETLIVGWEKQRAPGRLRQNHCDMRLSVTTQKPHPGSIRHFITSFLGWVGVGVGQDGGGVGGGWELGVVDGRE